MIRRGLPESRCRLAAGLTKYWNAVIFVLPWWPWMLGVAYETPRVPNFKRPSACDCGRLTGLCWADNMIA